MTIGVTGTCGKTVTSLFLRSIFEATGGRFGLVGALGWSDGVTTSGRSGRAIPDAEGLATMLAAMVERGCLGGVIEVSSEALEQQRVEGLAFDAAVVTDLGGVAGSEPRRAAGSGAGSRRGSSARSSPAARRWSTPTIPTPSCSARSTSTRGGSRSRSSGPPT